MKKILIVEDEEIVRNLMELALSAYDVEMAEDAEKGLELAKAKHFDLIFTDYRMGEINGLEFIKMLRENGIDNKVILVSGWAPEQIPEGVATLDKPFTLDQLGQLVSETFGE